MNSRYELVIYWSQDDDCFVNLPTRVTKESAIRRNEIVAALADDACIAHIAAGGQTARIAEMLAGWQVPIK